LSISEGQPLLFAGNDFGFTDVPRDDDETA
jgi:uncharacterized protein with PIN domain